MLEADIVDIGKLKWKNSLLLKRREYLQSKILLKGFFIIEEIQII